MDERRVVSEWVNDGKPCVFCASLMCSNPKAHGHRTLAVFETGDEMRSERRQRLSAFLHLVGRIFSTGGLSVLEKDHRRACMDPACLNDSDHDAHTVADKRGDFVAENPATWGAAERVVADVLEHFTHENQQMAGLSIVRQITDALREANLLEES